MPIKKKDKDKVCVRITGGVGESKVCVRADFITVWADAKEQSVY